MRYDSFDPSKNSKRIAKHLRAGDLVKYGQWNDKKIARWGIVTSLKNGMSFNVLDTNTHKIILVNIFSILDRISAY